MGPCAGVGPDGGTVGTQRSSWDRGCAGGEEHLGSLAAMRALTGVGQGSPQSPSIYERKKTAMIKGQQGGLQDRGAEFLPAHMRLSGGSCYPVSDGADRRLGATQEGHPQGPIRWSAMSRHTQLSSCPPSLPSEAPLIAVI